MCISVHICAYLCISVHIQKLNFSKKKLNFSKNKILVLNSFSEKAGLYAPQNFKIPLFTPGIDPRTFLVCATALTVALTPLWKSFILSGTYFWNMFISVNICSYLCISVHMRVYACIYRSYPDLVRSDQYLSQCPYMDGGGQPAVRVAGYWQFVTDTYDIHRYEQDMLTWVSYEEICTCEYLGEKYKQISTYLNGINFFFLGRASI